jgi:Uri superfamily endonuclease
MMYDGLISILGGESLSGTYVLRLRAEREIAVRFGRFQQAQPAVMVPAGDCLYVGSAMRGLGARLLRHASRVDANNPQPIRAKMAEAFVAAGLVKGNVASTGSTSLTQPALSLSKRPFPAKRLHWHIDYLLERPEVELTHVIVLRSVVRLETAVADWLIQDPAVCIITPGLGARDNPGRTHLLVVRAAEDWWQRLPHQLLLLSELRR